MKLPRFTLRELFLLVALAAMGCGWWVDRTHLSRRVSDIEREAALTRAQLEMSPWPRYRWSKK
jgi:hypothetical protein